MFKRRHKHDWRYLHGGGDPYGTVTLYLVDEPIAQVVCIVLHCPECGHLKRIWRRI